MSRLLADTTALVTGAALRLGRAVSLALADEGANVVVHYGTSSAEAEQVAEEIRARGPAARTVQADLADPEQVESLVPRALELTGSLGLLINNASTFPADSLSDMQRRTLIRCMDVNTWAPLALSRAFASHAGRGAILNFLDTRVAGYDWKHVSYIVSKDALALLTRMLALELAPDISVNAVAPGLILPPPGEDETYLDRLAYTVPLRRHGSSNDIVEAVLYLLKSEFVTGQVLYVDGGRHLVSPDDSSSAARGESDDVT